jgi:hypothetical protein
MCFQISFHKKKSCLVPIALEKCNTILCELGSGRLSSPINPDLLIVLLQYSTIKIFLRRQCIRDYERMYMTEYYDNTDNNLKLTSSTSLKISSA